jgi:integrase/recombinase XerD
MLAEYFQSPIRIEEIRGCPAGRMLEGFTRELHQAGYAQLTARRHLRAAEHLIHWTGGRDIPVSALEERFITEFSQHLNLCQCPGYGRSHRLELENGVRLFIGYLRRTGVLTTPVNEEPLEKPTILVSFDSWMRQQRGTCDATLYNYGLDLRDLLKDLGEDPARFPAQALRNFVLERTQRCGWAAAKRCITAVRAFLRFLIADGRCAAGLDASIPAFAHWRLSALSAARSRGASWVEAGVIWIDDRSIVFQTPDSTSGSPACESHGDPPGRGLRSDESAGVQRHVLRRLGMERQFGLHFPCPCPGVQQLSSEDAIQRLA